MPSGKKILFLNNFQFKVSLRFVLNNLHQVSFFFDQFEKEISIMKFQLNKLQIEINSRETNKSSSHSETQTSFLKSQAESIRQQLNQKTEELLIMKQKTSSDDFTPSSASLPEINSEEFSHQSTSSVQNRVIMVGSTPPHKSTIQYYNPKQNQGKKSKTELISSKCNHDRKEVINISSKVEDFHSESLQLQSENLILKSKIEELSSLLKSKEAEFISIQKTSSEFENKRNHQNKKKIHFLKVTLKKFQQELKNQKEENITLKNSSQVYQEQQSFESKNSINREEHEMLENELKLKELENQSLKESQMQLEK